MNLESLENFEELNEVELNLVNGGLSALAQECSEKKDTEKIQITSLCSNKGR